jgi:hypothetical protein
MTYQKCVRETLKEDADSPNGEQSSKSEEESQVI